ncbi:hypothetical protein UT300012_32780 [Paraclostridium bifermentans]
MKCEMRTVYDFYCEDGDLTSKTITLNKDCMIETKYNKDGKINTVKGRFMDIKLKSKHDNHMVETYMLLDTSKKYRRDEKSIKIEDIIHIDIL